MDCYNISLNAILGFLVEKSQQRTEGFGEILRYFPDIHPRSTQRIAMFSDGRRWEIPSEDHNVRYV
jgi:hypothetical protein